MGKDVGVESTLLGIEVVGAVGTVFGGDAGLPFVGAWGLLDGDDPGGAGLLPLPSTGFEGLVVGDIDG